MGLDELTGIPPSQGETLDAEEGDTGTYLSPLLEGSTNTGTIGLGVGGRRMSGDSAVDVHTLVNYYTVLLGNLVDYRAAEL